MTPQAVLERLLPRPVRVAERTSDVDGVELFPQEQAAIADAVESRRREFATVRACARDALAEMGVAAAPIVPGAAGAPTWPPGVVGSMTHCTGYRAAAVGRQVDVAALGIDAEPDAALPDGVLESIRLAQDAAGLAAVAARGVAADRLLFCAKEAVYKAWFPLARRWLGFEDAAVTLRPDGTFTARLLVDGTLPGGGRLTRLAGRWLAADGLILTAVVVLAGPEHSGKGLANRDKFWKPEWAI